MKITFKDFILLHESVTVKNTSYGTNIDTNNAKFFHINDEPGLLGTLFKENNIFYLVSIDYHNKCEVSFGTSNEYSLDYNEFTMSRISTKNPLSVIGKVFYVSLLIINKSKRDNFCFVGSDPGLVRLYNRLIDNEYFLDSVLEYGFKYVGVIDQYHTFRRV